MQQVYGSQNVRRDRLVRPIPGLSHVRLCPQMKDQRLAAVAFEGAKRHRESLLVGEIAPMHHDLLPQVSDVVQGT